MSIQRLPQFRPVQVFRPQERTTKSFDPKVSLVASALELSGDSLKISGHFLGLEAEIAIQVAKSRGIRILHHNASANVLSSLMIGQSLPSRLLRKLIELLRIVDSAL